MIIDIVLTKLGFVICDPGKCFAQAPDLDAPPPGVFEDLV